MNCCIRRCRAAIFLGCLFCIVPPAKAEEVLFSCDAVSAVLGADTAELRLTLANPSSQARRIMLTPPLVARIDQAERLFSPLPQTQALDIRISQLDIALPPGQRQTVHVTVRQRAALPAGRYRLAFEATDARDRSRVASASACLTVPPVVQVGQPQAVVIDTVEHASHIAATLRFAVQGNIEQIAATVSAGDLICDRDDGPPLRLPLDAMAGVELAARGTLHPGAAKAAFTPAAVDADQPRQFLSGTVHLASKGAEGIEEDIYVRLYWKRNAGQPLPAGRYHGQVRLLVVPDLKRSHP